MNYNVKKIADYYGKETQIIKLAEECSELSQACCKFEVENIRNELHYDERMDRIAEEIADVEILIEQIKYLFDVGIEVNEWKHVKIYRTLERIGENGQQDL